VSAIWEAPLLGLERVLSNGPPFPDKPCSPLATLLLLLMLPSEGVRTCNCCSSSDGVRWWGDPGLPEPTVNAQPLQARPLAGGETEGTEGQGGLSALPNASPLPLPVSAVLLLLRGGCAGSRARRLLSAPARMDVSLAMVPSLLQWVLPAMQALLSEGACASTLS